MWGLEYLILFGLPKNKLEVWDGCTRCVFPFLDRASAEAHFALWTETLSRWLRVEAPRVAESANRREAEINSATLTLYPLPIELRLPIEVDPLRRLERALWRRDFWEAQPSGCETGWDSLWDHGDLRMNLWRLFETVEKQVGGRHCGRVGLILPGVAGVEPDHYYFRPERNPRMIQGDYVDDVPDLIAEVLSAAQRPMDRGPRMELYRKAGVRQLWLLEPARETVEVFELAASGYRRVSTHGPGESFQCALFPGVAVSVDEMFDTQMKRRPDPHANDEPEPIPEWLIAPEKRLGLEYLLLVGHPGRRYEVWGDRAPCVLAFGSEQEAWMRLRHFLEDACRWEGAPVPQPAMIEPGFEVAEVGRFRFTRRGRVVHLDVAVELERYRSLLEAWATDGAWDWGEDED